MLFPESNVSIHIKKQSAEFLITGRADWAMGYKSMGDEGSLLNAMVAKQRSEFSKGEAQLTAYLAILRENRRRAKKVNYRTQGFYSDGTRFGFLCITEEGVVRHSRIFDISKKGELKVVFSFIVNMMETAMKMTPTVTPTKLGPRRDLEVESYHDEVWTEIYKWVHESVVVSPDSTEDDLIDIERCVSPNSTEDDLINIS